MTHKHCPVEGRSVLTKHQPSRAALSQTLTANLALKNALHPKRQETTAGPQKETEDEERKAQTSIEVIPDKRAEVERGETRNEKKQEGKSMHVCANVYLPAGFWLSPGAPAVKLMTVHHWPGLYLL